MGEGRNHYILSRQIEFSMVRHIPEIHGDYNVNVSVTLYFKANFCIFKPGPNTYFGRNDKQVQNVFKPML